MLTPQAAAPTWPEARRVEGRRWNGVRFDAERRAGHVESYFAKLVDAEGRRALWVKATILAKKGGAPVVAEAWAVAFDRAAGHVAAKQSVPFERASFARDRLEARVASLEFDDGRLAGSVESRGTRIAFDLAWPCDDAPLVQLPAARMYEGPFPSSKLVTPVPDARFFGHYEVGGERVEVDGWRGMQGHNWGRAHAPAYAWAHVNEWEGEHDLVVEVVTARVRVAGVLAPPLTLACVVHRGVRYLFHDVRSLATARGAIGARAYRFEAGDRRARIIGELSAETRDFVGLAYENPDGPTTHCLNSKIASGEVRFEIAGRPPERARTRGAALELGTLDAEHGVAMLA